MSSLRLREYLKPRSVLAVSALLVASASIGATAWAMRVAPMVSELTTTGVGSAARIEVGNVGAAPMPFETTITRMELDEDENLIETPADENFLVFPPQGIVGVGGRQMVRVQWVGAPNLDASEAYYLWVKQLPINTDVEQSEEMVGSASVQVLYTMKALIVVAPEGAEPDVSVVSATPVTMTVSENPEVEGIEVVDEAADGTPAETRTVFGVRVTVENKGRRYALMSGATWTVSGTDVSGQSYVHQFSGEEISQHVGVGFLPPRNGRRNFELPTAVALDASKPINVTFSR
ncbi:MULTISPECIES: fimbria/pilus periplasmic chaperone [unclassified Brevundimonas]|uniref:fimbria/pilus periplasmic chaperone n=1 Tax=unclassified Brevundimonas TaxID=2622653 RepID=UPI0025C0C94D|nr:MULTISPECIES: fimbria/pilus periplasmic chaperone [unclassified Brevundimonas]